MRRRQVPSRSSSIFRSQTLVWCMVDWETYCSSLDYMYSRDRVTYFHKMQTEITAMNGVLPMLIIGAHFQFPFFWSNPLFKWITSFSVHMAIPFHATCPGFQNPLTAPDTVDFTVGDFLFPPSRISFLFPIFLIFYGKTELWSSRTVLPPFLFLPTAIPPLS